MHTGGIPNPYLAAAAYNPLMMQGAAGYQAQFANLMP